MGSVIVCSSSTVGGATSAIGATGWTIVSSSTPGVGTKVDLVVLEIVVVRDIVGWLLVDDWLLDWGAGGWLTVATGAGISA